MVQIADRPGVGHLRQVSHLKEAAAAGGAEPFHVIEEASADGFQPYRLIDKAVRACDGEAIDVEDSSIR